MTNFKGTKGKWSVIKDSTSLFSEDKEEKIITCWIYLNRKKEAEANAKLISCAPEMLEILEKIFKDMQNETQLVHKWDIKKLIKKATDE